jgi:hypothetical protein
MCIQSRLVLHYSREWEHSNYFFQRNGRCCIDKAATAAIARSLESGAPTFERLKLSRAKSWNISILFETTWKSLFVDYKVFLTLENHTRSGLEVVIFWGANKGIIQNRPSLRETVLAYRRRRSCRDKALGISIKGNGTISQYFSSSCTMLPTLLSDSTYLSWISGFLLLAVVLYRYSTKTDIPKIRGIPEIPGALPMFTPLRESQLMSDLDIFSTLAM